ncbi:hypothetical protein PZ938_04705 [Luteipulveratus sp. YIM 133132]|uniref:hypothetical protein n=1 Tax=Luteipulveratus flavus TaxID=3031728 RepID=UPI0023B0E4FA|nr:hypothetical protein [Luteipulveratus sp. YIM 133132]MDE9364897.1 hypothetical protein [Luteipulveratus sp. YIM 133132]
MSRRTKLTAAAAGLGVVAAGAVAVPALAASGSATPSVSASSSPTAGTGSSGSGSDSTARDHGPRGGMSLFGSTAAQVATAAGATETQLRQGLRDGKSLVQIASSHGVSKSTLVSRLGALVDQQAGTIVDRKHGGQPDAGRQDSGRSNPLADALAGLVKKGTITQGQADAITKAVQQQRRTDGPAGKQDRPGLMKDHASDLASLLKLSEAQLRTQLQSGKSLAEVAKTQGVSRDTVVAKLASLLKADLPTIVDQKNAFGPQMRGGHGGPGGPGMGMGQQPGSGSGSNGSSGSGTGGGTTGAAEVPSAT